jgi:SAM-dependent methyltransferase
VLELGCGTGRILLVLAQAGFKVAGVDISEGMLEVCAARAAEIGVADRASLVRADMSHPGELPEGPFNLALCALNTFAYLATTESQIAMLEAVCARLVGHGILIVDLTPPLRHLLPPTGGEVLYQGSYLDFANAATLHKFVVGYEQPSTQSHQVQTIYDLEGPDGSLRRLTQSASFRWTGRYEMQLLLERAGYRVEKVYGSYDLDDYANDSERMIFVARKHHG